MRPDKEQNLLKKACELFRANTGLRVDIKQRKPEAADAFAYLRNGNKATPLLIDVKFHPTHAVIGAIAQQFKQYPEKGVLVADYINPIMAERLKALDIWFLDAAGNAYINNPPVLVYVKGNKPDRLTGKTTKRRAFQTTGLKVVFALLCNPDLVNAPYRNIALAADVALGTVGWVLTDLKQLGHLVETGKKNRRLKGLKKLFQRWVEAYPDQLKPKLQLGTFTTNESEWWKNTDLREFNTYMGGETAADYLTHYLIPEIQTLYVREKPQALQATLKLRKDPGGNIELLDTFWSIECDWTDNKIVHPILIYADLLATGDARNIETAEIIYDKEIAQHIRED